MTITITTEVAAVIGALASTIVTLAGVIYRNLQNEKKDLKDENAALRSEAKEMVKAKDSERDEWRRIAMTRAGESPR